MKIPQNLPQFEREKAIMLVCATNEAIFYLLWRGEIITQDKFKIVKEREKGKREGLFLKGGRGKIFEIGSVFKPKKRKFRKEFLDGVKSHLKKIVQEQIPEHIYLFAPDYLVKETESVFPKEIKEKIKIIKKGNYLEFHPLELLEMIVKEKESKKVKPISEEAKKLLEKFKFRRKT